MSASDLAGLIDRARRRLPASHGALLEQIGVQEAIVEDWPREVQAIYKTLLDTPPSDSALAAALAVWLPTPRVVAFNARLLRRALDDAELSESTRQAAIDHVAWHEYGHALSVVRASDDLRSGGPRLVELLPPGLRRTIDFPGGYRRAQVFDEVIANVYALMISRAVHHHNYGFPEFLHRDVVQAFQAVVPWPPE